MIIQHDAEESRYQYLIRKSDGGQYKNREGIAALNSRECLQDTALNEASANPRNAAIPGEVAANFLTTRIASESLLQGRRTTARKSQPTYRRQTVTNLLQQNLLRVRRAWFRKLLPALSQFSLHRQTPPSIRRYSCQIGSVF
jgi:hypothetical protein